MNAPLFSLENRANQHLHFFSQQDWNLKKSEFPFLHDGFFKAERDEVKSVYLQEQLHVFIGLGEKTPTLAQLQKSALIFSAKHYKLLETKTTRLHSYSLNKQQIETMLQGLYSGTYQYQKPHSHPFWQKEFSIELSDFSLEELSSLETKIKAICKGEEVCKEWLNKPANQKTPPLFSKFIQEQSETHGWKHRSLNSEECLQEDLGAFMAVAKGSHYPPSFTIVEYGEKKEGQKSLGLIGKSIVFDTGGISLKHPDNMHYMKSDMGGGCAVLGFLVAASLLKLPLHIVAVFPITDNVISSRAYLPSDVVKAHNGLEIEVLNTDAEGRLTLADGLSYLIKNFDCDTVLDLATLTGSAVRMFGASCAPHFSSDLTLSRQLEEAGEITGQRLWPMPLWEEWKEPIQSDVADLKNISLSPIGDCIIAAKFLQQFTHKHLRWAHLDIAGVAFGSVPYAKEKAATSYGVQLLLKFTENLL